MIVYRANGNSSITGVQRIGKWNDSTIPVYDIHSMHALNQFIGYIKHINAGSGTVLYRGQCNLHESLTPSILHQVNKDLLSATEKLDQSISSVVNDEQSQRSLFDFDSEMRGWSVYQRVIIESIFQHYGINTYSVDFVDNHWTALWFASHKYVIRQEGDINRFHYELRSPYTNGHELQYIQELTGPVLRNIPQKPSEMKISDLDDSYIELITTRVPKDRVEGILNKILQYQNNKALDKWRQKNDSTSVANQKKDYLIPQCNDEAHGYIILYVADTMQTNIHGLYIGNDVYTVDLRKALSSHFLRPSAQHGWTVRGKIRDSYNFNDSVAAVLRIKVSLILNMLGTGDLLTQENFFPPANIDIGYRDLLKRERNSTHSRKRPNIISKALYPVGTIPVLE